MSSSDSLFAREPVNSGITSAPGFYSMFDFEKTTLINIIIILLFLAILGINLLSVVGSGLETAANVVGPPIVNILSILVYSIGELVRLLVNLVSNSIIFIVELVSGAIISLVNLIQTGASGGVPKFSSTGNDSEKKTTQPVQVLSHEYSAKPAESSVWCRVGTFSGGSVCAEIGKDDICQSKQIFPSRDLCIAKAIR